MREMNWRKAAKRGKMEERNVKTRQGGKMMDRMKVATRCFGGRIKVAMRGFGGRMEVATRCFGGKMMGKIKAATKGSGKMVMMKMTRSKLRGREMWSGSSLKVTCGKMEMAGVGQLMFGRMMKMRKERDGKRWTTSEFGRFSQAVQAGSWRATAR